MAINIILVIIGLIICFGGIYIKKITGFVIGLGLGALATLIVQLAIGGFSLFYFLEIGEEELLIVLVGGIIFGVLSAIYEKICVAISTFLSVFSLSTLLMLILGTVEEILIYIIASVVSLLLSFISTKIYTYSYIVISAITGAFIATIGGYGLYREIEFYDTIKKFIFNEEARLIILILTLVLGIIGFIFQLYRFNVINRKKAGEQTEKQTLPIQKKHKELSFDFHKITNSFLVKELKKNWFFYSVSLLFVCSDLNVFNGILRYEIMYFAITAAVFFAFNSTSKQLTLWILPLIIPLVESAIYYLHNDINIYLTVSFICESLSSEGLVILICLFAKLISKFTKHGEIKNVFKTRSIIFYSLVFLSFLTIHYLVHFRNTFIPTGHFWSGISVYKAIFLSIEAIVVHTLLYIFDDIKNSKNNTSPIFKEKIKNLIPTVVIFVLCFATTFSANKISDVIEENKYKTKYDCYNELISTYSQAVTQGLNAFESQSDYYDDINERLVLDCYHYGASIAYALYDIDSNGKKELIVSNGKNIYDIYTVYNNKAVNLFPNENFGYRHYVDILNNGQIIAHGSGGWSSALAEVYNIEDGYYVDICEAYFYDDLDPSYFLNIGYTMLSKEEYTSKLNNQRKSSVLNSLKWTIIYGPVS